VNEGSGEPQGAAAAVPLPQLPHGAAGGAPRGALSTGTSAAAPAPVSGLRVAAAILAKDLRVDLRSRDRLGHMLLFSALVTVVLRITLPDPTAQTRAWIPALFWIVFLFSSLLGLGRSFEAEFSAGGIESLVQVPCDRGFVFLGKGAANLVSLFLLQLWTALLFAVFLDVNWRPALGAGLALAALGALGFSAVGTLFGALAASLRNRELMLPLLLFPMLSPVLLLGARATGLALASEPVSSVWWGTLGLYGWIFVLAGYFLFDYVLVED
jgi:heme exporter protein B